MPNPPLFPEAFCNSGDANAIPEHPAGPPNLANLDQGFPPRTSVDLMPVREDFNGILKQITEHLVFLGQGGTYGVDAGILAGAGYPMGAVLLLNDGYTLVVSAAAGNTIDPNTSSAGWIPLNGPTTGDWNWAIPLGGPANAYTTSLRGHAQVPGVFEGSPLRPPILLSFSTGLTFANSNTGASTITFQGTGITTMGPYPIVRPDGSDLRPGDIHAGLGVYFAVFQPTLGKYFIVSPLGAGDVNGAVVSYTTSSTSDTMAGTGVTFTPSTTKVRIMWSLQNGATGVGGTAKLRLGIGTPPIPGAAASGTVLDTVAVPAGSGPNYSFMLVQAAMTPGQKVWVDGSFAAASAASATAALSVTIEEVE